MGVSQSSVRITDAPVVELIEERTGEKVRRCYQCGNCSASCPAAYDMDYTPRRVMRALQLGQLDEVLNSSAIWTCLGCQTCEARCPRQIEIPRVMDALRHIAIERGVKPKDGDVYAFHRSFLQLLRYGGRLYEVGLIGLVNLRTGKPLANFGVGLPMLSKGKVSLMPERSKGTAAVNAIFRKVNEIERRHAK